ncbi:MAG: hypothetical protein RIM80_12675, partial [Alphaproteobacteria bacterium]
YGAPTQALVDHTGAIRSAFERIVERTDAYEARMARVIKEAAAMSADVSARAATLDAQVGRSIEQTGRWATIAVVCSIVLGVVVALLIMRLILKPTREVIDCFAALTAGDYTREISGAGRRDE